MAKQEVAQYVIKVEVDLPSVYPQETLERLHNAQRAFIENELMKFLGRMNHKRSRFHLAWERKDGRQDGRQS